eukprot:scaffold16058_cov171-Amphora_coffeaeformis.AAC.3
MQGVPFFDLLRGKCSLDCIFIKEASFKSCNNMHCALKTRYDQGCIEEAFELGYFQRPFAVAALAIAGEVVDNQEEQWFLYKLSSIVAPLNKSLVPFCLGVQ